MTGGSSDHGVGDKTQFQKELKLNIPYAYAGLI